MGYKWITAELFRDMMFGHNSDGWHAFDQIFCQRQALDANSTAGHRLWSAMQHPDRSFADTAQQIHSTGKVSGGV